MTGWAFSRSEGQTNSETPKVTRIDIAYVTVIAPGAFVSLLPQDVPRETSGTVREIVSQGIAQRPPDETLDEHEAHWRGERSLSQILSRMDLPADDRFELLSSGMKRRVLLARAVASSGI